MLLNDWLFYFYFPILNEFNFDISEDAESARVLQEVAKLEKAEKLKTDEKAVVLGNSPDKRFEVLEGFHVITAGKTVLNYDGRIDVHVTDLDEGFKALCDAADRAKVVVVHAHGDNLELIKEYVPSLGKVVGTTQYLPFDKIYNFGGFTDGDRAAIIAKAFFEDVKLVNFRFDVAESELKLKKLRWARRILEFEGLL